MRIFCNQEVDRPALKLWGAQPGTALLHPAYEPVQRLALQTSDIFAAASSPFSMYWGKNEANFVSIERRPTDSPLWQDEITLAQLSGRVLRQVCRVSTKGEPPYVTEHFVKEPADLESLLRLPYEPYPFHIESFSRTEAAVGNRGVTLFSLDHPGYALQRLTGSETLAYFSVDCRPLLLQAVEIFSRRVRQQAEQALKAGVRLFQWVGPEVFLPPLLSPKDFEDFCFGPDAALCSDIHNSGGYVWVHSHGKVADFIPRFIQMGVDVLNPLEPPKNGDVALSQLVERYGAAIGWEGNVEIQELLLSDKERLTPLITQCVQAGAASGRFILCPSAGFMEYPAPTERYIDNLLFYLRFGLQAVQSYARG